MKQAIVMIMMGLAMVGCTTIDYVGEEYPPTIQVDMYFSMEDVRYDYQVMGHLVATAQEIVSAEKMQSKIMKEARRKGADGVVILGLSRYQTNASTSYTETTETKQNKSTTVATTKTEVEENKEIRATFIKYR